MNDQLPSQDATDPTLGMPVDQASALLPEDLLQGGEIIILILKPSLLYVVLWCLGQLVGLFAATCIAVWINELYQFEWFNSSTLWMVLAVVLCIRILWQFMDWLSKTYVLTDRRLITIDGVFRVHIFQTLLRKVQQTDILFTVRERCFGLGTLAFSTAGTDQVDTYWLMLRRPLAVQRKIMQVIQRYG